VLDFPIGDVDEPLKLFVPLNFDEGDPVEVLTRVSITR
jgi:hypothetical protein